MKDQHQIAGVHMDPTLYLLGIVALLAAVLLWPAAAPARACATAPSDSVPAALRYLA